MYKLTSEQQIFAELNHTLVYKYLSMKKLSIDEFYDIAVFGYLRAVQRYLTDEELRQYKFSTIAFAAMRSEINAFHRAQKRQMRSARVLSLDYELNKSGTLTFGDTDVQDNNVDICGDLCAKEAFEEAYESFDDTQRKIVSLCSYGYKNNEIARALSLKRNDVKNCLSDIYDTIEYTLAA